MLHRALDGDAQLPLEYVVGRICQEFHCLPSAAWREYLSLPAGFLETIIDYRNYAWAKAQYDAKGQRTSELTDLVIEHDFMLVQEGRGHAQP